jgi:ribosomal-protein-alanine N-acetyltransferase
VPKSEPRNALEVGPRVYVREPTARDRDELLRLNRASRRLHRPWVSPATTPALFDRWLERCRRAEVQSFLVCRLDDHAIVGVFTLSQIFRRSFQNAYLGYYAGEPYAGQGYMREGMQLVLRHVFTAMKLHRVEANVQPENAASIALAKRSGFRLEGFSPRYLKIAGRWRDHERWAITVEDFRALRRKRSASGGSPPFPARPPRAPSPGRGRRSRRVSSSPGIPRSG